MDTFLETDAQGMVDTIDSFMTARLHGLAPSRLKRDIALAVSSPEFYDALDASAADYRDRPLIYKLTFMVFDSDGKRLFVSNNALPVDVPSPGSLLAFEKAKTRAETAFKTIDDGKNLEYRVVSVPVFYQGHPVALVQETCLTGGLAAAFSTLRTMLLVGLPLLLMLSALVMLFLLNRAFRPVTDMIGTIHRISGDNLSLRVPLPPGDDEIVSLAETFNRMLSRVESSFVSQTELVQDLSHQLRTPLAVLRGTLETGLRRIRSAEEYEEILESNLEEVDRITRLIESLLFLARLDSCVEDIHRERIDLGKFFSSLAEDFGPLWMEKGITLEVKGADGISLWGDPVLLRQVFINLLDNARKHSLRGAVITISVVSVDRFCEVRIHNDGTAIPEEDLPHIFERFYRSHSASGEVHKGFGLGLPIARSIIERHDGQISAANSLSGGVEFTVSLPAYKENKKAGIAPTF
jgi:heavy metal sensor kinase